MKIAIIYIGIGRYTVFWDEFYKSCEKNFIRNAQKHYFYFTDSKEYKSDDKVTIIPQENLGWPLVTCLRYKFINTIKEDLKEYDYIFFFNGNYEIYSEVTEKEFLPTDEEGGLIALKHNYNKYKKADDFPWERNPKSTSYIPYGTDSFYYQACLWGGKTPQVLKLVEDCEKMMDEDLANDIVPIFHDESLFNKYMLDKKHKTLGYEYGFVPEGKPFWKYWGVKMTQRPKSWKYGGVDWLRGLTDEKQTFFGYILEKLHFSKKK